MRLAPLTLLDQPCSWDNSSTVIADIVNKISESEIRPHMNGSDTFLRSRYFIYWQTIAVCE